MGWLKRLFSGSEKLADRVEAAAPRLSQLVEDITEALRRIKVLEREFDDLHAAYRRIRSSAGGVARQALPPGGSSDEQPGPVDRKAALRAKAREMARKRLEGRGDGSI